MAKKRKSKSQAGASTMKLLVENTITLQKVLTDLSVNLNRLSKDMEQMLSLFKEASKTMGEQRAADEVANETQRELITKLDSLIDHNKIIARGLILLESSIKEKEKQKEYGF